MPDIIQKHGPDRPARFPINFFSFNMKIIRNGAAVIMALAFLMTAVDAFASENTSVAQATDFPAVTDMEKGLSIEVKPVDLSPDRPARFSISLKTHSGSLDFDLKAVSDLKDDKGRVYKPTGWDGSPSGGHHRSGVLSFPEIGAEAKQVKLTVRDVRGVAERVFKWVLP